ncbi:hypothetical protein C5G87_19500 [Paenibacillus peoriae]|uniref:hypothetical protein n=1 Tax=Paenibacillus peoriae TaxID=59893 RepID=UPI000CEC844D|nr:hypothetical protein [Paenibacillus peoriae]PPQ47117.1 hypothetical protein C5G87_19500 [Paenibacillus peoriae]
MLKKVLFIALLSVALTACGSNFKETTTRSGSSSTSFATEQTVSNENTAQQTSTIEATDKEYLFAEFLKDGTPMLTEDQASMEQTSYDFIAKNSDLFPSTDKSKVINLVDKSVTTKHLNKSLNLYLNKFVKISGDVIDIEEDNIPIGTTAIVYISDENDNTVMAVYPGASGEIFEGDVATVIGVPIANFSYENVSGGYTNTTLLAASFLAKENQ